LPSKEKLPHELWHKSAPVRVGVTTGVGDGICQRNYPGFFLFRCPGAKGEQELAARAFVIYKSRRG